MSSLMIRCPKTGSDVWTGVDTDLQSLEAIPEAPLFYGPVPLQTR